MTEQWPARACGTADLIVRSAARRWPDRCAVQAGDQRISFAELDRRVDRFARVVAGMTSGPDAVVAVSSPLTPAFIIGYYGTIRAGRRVAVLNPLLGEDALRQNVSSVSPELAFLDARTEECFERIEAGLGFPVRRMSQHEPLPGVTHAHRLIGDLAEAAPGSAACLLFTSGTTGRPKTVPLTHRNISINAVQVADAHELEPRSVTLNFLPSFHPMHMSSAVYAGATQVLHPQPDLASLASTANEVGATHLYTIPMRLSVLARAIQSCKLTMPSLRLIASGGSALPPAVALRLSSHFGVPVIQGYGMAETSPLTFSDLAANPMPGSVGFAVRGTRVRIVDVQSRQPVPSDGLGELQVSGPQVMAGYLDGCGGASVVNDDGWLSTGDVGRIDETGRLFLTDRLRDTFKCDNWLVSPSELERGLCELALVSDCVVFGIPHELHGEVPAALLVLADGSGAAAADEVLARHARNHPYYERLTRYLVVDGIARSMNAKIDRSRLREQLLAATDTVSLEFAGGHR